MTLRLADHVSVTDTPDAVVLLDERTGRYWQLNSAGATVLRVLLAGGDQDEVATLLCQDSGADPDQVRADVAEIVEQLRTAGLAVGP